MKLTTDISFQPFLEGVKLNMDYSVPNVNYVNSDALMALWYNEHNS